MAPALGRCVEKSKCVVHILFFNPINFVKENVSWTGHGKTGPKGLEERIKGRLPPQEGWYWSGESIIVHSQDCALTNYILSYTVEQNFEM